MADTSVSAMSTHTGFYSKHPGGRQGKVVQCGDCWVGSAGNGLGCGQWTGIAGKCLFQLCESSASLDVENGGRAVDEDNGNVNNGHSRPIMCRFCRKGRSHSRYSRLWKDEIHRWRATPLISTSLSEILYSLLVGFGTYGIHRAEPWNRWSCATD